MRFTQKIKLRINILLLTLAAVFLLLALIVVYSPDATDKLGKKYIKEYTQRYQGKFEKAVSNLDDDNIEVAEGQLEDWSDVLKGDRAYPIKRNLMLALLDKLREQKKYEKMKALSLLLRESDPRDISAKIYYYEALRHSLGGEAEGLSGLSEIHTKFPKNHGPNFFLAALYEAGEKQILDGLISQKIFEQETWQVFWNTGEGFNRNNSTPPLALTQNSDLTWAISAAISSKTKALRIDPPPNSFVSISDVWLSTKDSERSISLSEVKTHMMTLDGERLLTSGAKDPYFYFNVSESIGAGAQLNVDITINFEVAIDYDGL